MLRSSNGNAPDKRAYNNTPIAHTSTSVPKYCFPKTSSGAAYVGDPQDVKRGELIPPSGLAHKPKSISLRF